MYAKIILIVAMAVIGLLVSIGSVFYKKARRDFSSAIFDTFFHKSTLKNEYPFSDNGILTLTDNAGSVEIEGWKGNTLIVEAIKRAKIEKDLDDIHVAISVVENRAEIKTETKSNGYIKAFVDYKIKVPKNVCLESIEQGAGSVKIKDIKGSIRANVGAGSITIENAENSVEIKTGAGSIKVMMTTVPSSAAIKLHTGTGSIKLGLPEEVNAMIHAESNTGSIKSDFDIIGEKTKKSLVGDFRKGIIGQPGGGTIELQSNVGSISIKRN